MVTALRQRMSRIFQRLDEIISHVATAATVSVVLVVFIVTLAFKGFPSRWQMGFSTVSNAIVIMLLFAVKHTQDRQQTALQLKLDELIRSTPAADDHFVQIERADEKELGERKQDQIDVHETLRSGATSEERDIGKDQST
jgi:low affinity Fe/Cu permease